MTSFHRNIKGFIVQGGDPDGTGKGGESIYGQYMDDEICTDLKHDRRGIVSFANRKRPNTVGSQFFITYSRQAHLNGTNTIIGRVIDGFDTLDKLEAEPVDEKFKPIHNIKIESATIHANPIADEEMCMKKCPCS